MYLVLDTETTGPPLWKEPSDHPGQPHVVDVAWTLYGQDRAEIERYDAIINPGVPIPDEVAEIHGITTERAVAEGIAPEEAWSAFIAVIPRVDIVVGHNVSFDIRMMRILASRVTGEKWDNPHPLYCTMRKSTNHCRLLGAQGAAPARLEVANPDRSDAINLRRRTRRCTPRAARCRRIGPHLLPPQGHGESIMNAQSTALAERREVPAIDKLKTNLTARADEFKVALPSHISVEKFQRTIATAAMSNSSLLECDRTSLLLAAMKLAQDGLLPDGREAALVPFQQSYKGDDGEWYKRWLVQPMPMVYGLRKKILQSGQVASLETGLVYRAEVESGHFIYEIGMDPPIRHRPDLNLSDEDMSDDNIVAAYSIARIKNDHGEAYWSVEVMRRAEINRVRQTSQTGALGQTVKFGKRKGEPIPPKGPWVDWFGEMARKTVLRRHSKVLPMSGDVLDAINREDEVFAAEGASRLLDVEERGPVRLPSPEELDEQVDPETGEVLDSRGMTEVDEETAGELDAGPVDDEPEAEHAEREGDQAVQPDETPAWDKPVKKIRKQFRECDAPAFLAAVEKDFTNIMAGLPDEVVDEIEGLIRDKRKSLAGA